MSNSPDNNAVSDVAEIIAETLAELRAIKVILEQDDDIAFVNADNYSCVLLESLNVDSMTCM